MQNRNKIRPILRLFIILTGGIFMVFSAEAQTLAFPGAEGFGAYSKGAYQAIYLQGLPEMNLENIHLENLTMEAENGLMCMDADGITIKNLNLKTTEFPAMTFYNAKNIEINDLAVSESTSPLIFDKWEKTK